VPVVVDAAAEDLILREIVATGADLVTCSSHKFLCGTTAGLVCGRADLVRATYAQNRGIGRGMKVGKEGILGLMAALEYRMAQDLPAWTREQDAKVARILTLLEGAPGLRLSVEPDPTGAPFSRVRVDVSPAGGHSARSLCLAMEEGDPTIKLRAHHVDEGYFLIDAVDLNDEEIALVCARLREITGSGSRQ
jgi:L-seryl-tRNA(Ser) seleniumtransferase